MKVTLKYPIIPDNEQSPIVQELLAFIEQQSSIIQQLIEEIADRKSLFAIWAETALPSTTH
jgi:hypothetical protein